MRIYDNIQKFPIGQGDDYAPGCLLHYNSFNNYYKMIAIDLSKPQILDDEPKAIQEIDFTGNVNRDEEMKNVNENTTIFFIMEEAKEDFRFEIRDFLQGTVAVF